MFEQLDNLRKYGIFVGVFLSIIFILLSGMFFGFIHWTLGVTQTALQTTDCTIVNNTLVSSCQELFSLAVYPFLALKDVLVWASFFMIFGLVLAILVLGYQSGKSPVLMGVMVSFVGGITYLGIELSNIYRTLLDDAIFRTMMVDFTVYNKIMINFPWFIFFVGLFAVILSLVNYQRGIVNTDPEELNF